MKTSAIILIGLVCFAVHQSETQNVTDGEGEQFLKDTLKIEHPSCPNGAKPGETFILECNKCVCGEHGSYACVGCEQHHVGGYPMIQDYTKPYPECCLRDVDPRDIALGLRPDICRVILPNSTWTSPSCQVCSCQEEEVVCETKCEVPAEPSHYTKHPGLFYQYPECCPTYHHVCGEGMNVGDKWTVEGCVGCQCSETGVECLPCPLIHIVGDDENVVKNISLPYPQCCLSVP